MRCYTWLCSDNRAVILLHYRRTEVDEPYDYEGRGNGYIRCGCILVVRSSRNPQCFLQIVHVHNHGAHEKTFPSAGKTAMGETTMHANRHTQASEQRRIAITRTSIVRQPKRISSCLDEEEIENHLIGNVGQLGHHLRRKSAVDTPAIRSRAPSDPGGTGPSHDYSRHR